MGDQVLLDPLLRTGFGVRRYLKGQLIQIVKGILYVVGGNGHGTQLKDGVFPYGLLMVNIFSGFASDTLTYEATVGHMFSTIGKGVATLALFRAIGFFSQGMNFSVVTLYTLSTTRDLTRS